MLVFFSAGFLAGSFEQAAGVGQLRPAQEGAAKRQPTDLAHLNPPAPPRSVPAATALETVAAHGEPPSVRSAAQESTSPPLAERAFARMLLPELEAPGTMAVLAGLGVSESDLKAMTFGGGRPMSLPSRAAWSPMSAPAFTSPLTSPPQPKGAVVPEVPGAWITETIAPRAEKRTAAPAPEFILPIYRGRVTSMWNQGRYHPAIDLAAPLGTPVRASTRKQKVTSAGWRGGYGNLVTTRDPQGREHYYGHLQRIVARIGTILEQGDLLGLLGSTGHSTGPHVHYEVRVRGRNINPAGLLFPNQRVGRGYAWNEGGRPATTAVARSKPAQASRSEARVAKTRRSRARVARRSHVRPHVRLARHARSRIAMSYAPQRRYIQRQRSVRYATRYTRGYARR